MKLDQPKVVTFDVTYRCSLACNMCQTKWYQQDDRFNSTLSKEQIIQTAKRLNVEEGATFFRFLGAEPLLHPDIFEIISEVSKIGKTWLTTNGTLITDKVANQLVTSGLTDLCVSYHSPNEHYTGVSAEKITTRTIKGVQAIESAKQLLSRSLNVTVTNVITPANYTNLQAVVNLFHGLDVKLEFFAVHSMRSHLNNSYWNGQKAEYLGPNIDEPKMLNLWQKMVFRYQLQKIRAKYKRAGIRLLYFITSQLVYLYEELQAMLVYTPCTKPTQRIGVRADGKIFACEFLKTIDMGSITDDNLWNTAKREQLVVLTQSAKLEICRQCNRQSLYRPHVWPLRFVHKLSAIFSRVVSFTK